jgi:hypothetical protein
MFRLFKQKKPRVRPRPCAPPSTTKRLAVRRKQRLAEARVTWPGMLFTRSCAVKDLSAMGACIELAQDDTRASIIPPTVTLQILPDKRKIGSQVVWRKGRLLGLKFHGEYRPMN